MELNKNNAWRYIYNAGEDSRMSDIELILRMFAFAYLPEQKEAEQTQINLVKYLNLFVKRNCDFEIIAQEELEMQFIEIMDFFAMFFDKIIFRNGKIKEGEVSFTKKINPAILDAV